MTASSTLESAIDKAASIVAIVAVMIGIMHPVLARADYSPQTSQQTALIFEVNSIQNSVNTEQIQNTKSAPQTSLAYQTVADNDLPYQTQLAYTNLLRQYLSQRGSPLANCAELLVSLGANGDKILSLANAESGLGKRFIRSTYNMWGVGGGYWKMGNSPCEAVQSMDNFLNEYPRRSAVKYSAMSIEQMNGLYKQPAARHWVNNNYAILNDLKALRQQAVQIAQAKVGSPVVAVTAETELVNK
jgi:hypothetical protein